MKWALLAILVFSPLASEAGGRDTKPNECRVIEARSYGFVKCRFRPTKQQWRLTYNPTAYKQVKQSGQYQDMLRTLCDSKGVTIHEEIREIFSGSSQDIPCILELNHESLKK